jgi:hypothetical protein
MKKIAQEQMDLAYFVWNVSCGIGWMLGFGTDRKIQTLIQLQQQRIELLETEIHLLKIPLEDFVVVAPEGIHEGNPADPKHSGQSC